MIYFFWNKRRWKFFNFCGLDENIWISFPVITFDVQLILDWHKRRKLLWYKRQQNIIFRSVNYRSLSGSSCLGCNLLRFARADFFSRIAKRDIFHSNIRLDCLQKILPNWLVLYKSVLHMSSILVKYNFRLSLQLSEKQMYHFRTKKRGLQARTNLSKAATTRQTRGRWKLVETPLSENISFLTCSTTLTSTASRYDGPMMAFFTSFV